jgi:hypothetical protein
LSFINEVARLKNYSSERLNLNGFYKPENSNKQKIVNEASFQQIDGKLKTSEFNSVIYKGTPSFQKKIDGNILSLTQGASGHKNYFHWLFDILPKIKIFSEGYDLKSIDYFYLTELQPYQKKW